MIVVLTWSVKDEKRGEQVESSFGQKAKHAIGKTVGRLRRSERQLDGSTSERRAKHPRHDGSESRASVTKREPITTTLLTPANRSLPAAEAIFLNLAA